MTVHVLIVDDHPVVRGALRLALAGAWPDVAVTEADTLAAAEAQLRDGPSPDLVVLDLCLPGASGLSSLLAIRRAAPEARIAIFSALEADDVSASAYRLGAHVFIPKTATPKALIDALASVLDGPGRATAAAADEGDALRQALNSLSTAQLRVLVALANGQRNSEIAEAVGVTEATVKAHLTAIYKRLGVRNRTQAVLAARRLRAA